MNPRDEDYAAGLVDNPNPPCLSVYLSAHRSHPDNQQDPIRFKNLVEALKESLLQKFMKDEAGQLLEPSRHWLTTTISGIAH